MDKNAKTHLEETPETLNLWEVLSPYLSRWKWFALSALLALALAYAYLKYATPIYKASTIIMLKDDAKGGAINEFSILSDLDLSVKDNVENEVEVLRSRTLSEKVIEKLNLDVSYLRKDGFKTVDLYKNSPINFSITKLSDKIENVNDLNFFDFI